MAQMESLERTASEACGYRRRIRVVPEAGSVIALLEDDIHSMAVRLRHDGTTVLAVEPLLDRMPWTTCPGAAAVLIDTFVGNPLCEVTRRKERKANCTHLHDMAVIAADHAADADETCFDITVSDPIMGRRVLVLQKNGESMLRWKEQDGVLISPPAISGRSLQTLRDYIVTLPHAQAELARLLQWAGLVAHGRTIPMAEQSDASRIPPNCYTFQPERAAMARRVGKVIDFSTWPANPGEVLERQLGLSIY